MRKVKFENGTIYCKYHRSFEKKETCKKYCNILCKSNAHAIENYQQNEEEYNKYIQDKSSTIYDEELNYIASYNIINKYKNNE